MAPHDVGDHHARRCNTVFWACYIIDQEFGPLVGAPSSIRIEDVTARLPSDIDGSLKAEALGLQVRQSRLTATMVAGKCPLSCTTRSTHI